MSLPTPLPDDPNKWDGWRNYNSEDLYERLCLDYRSDPTNAEIEENCRQLLIWWQKKLPLKNQPGNPMAAMLRAGLDEAPQYLSQARAELLNPESRARFDSVLKSKLKERAQAEFHKFLSFSISGGVLTTEAEGRLMELGLGHGLSGEEIRELVDYELSMAGAVRQAEARRGGEMGGGEGVRAGGAAVGDPESEFRRLLNLSGLEDGDMTDDQRDAFVNMAENLGVDAGRAEDMIDDWIEEKEAAMFGQVSRPTPSAPVSVTASGKAGPAVPGGGRGGVPGGRTSRVVTLSVERDMSEEEEIRRFAPFRTGCGIPMVFIPSGEFEMGSAGAGAPPAETPSHKVYLTRYYMARFPVTNEQYERFDPAHRARRPGWAGPDHPVIYVNSFEAQKFCEWLSAREKRRFRLPTEAEWEYAARGRDGRLFPWGNHAGPGRLANFADRNTSFAWSDPRIDDGFAETSPVGSYPQGASPFGVMDMAGNVWEWCLDYFSNYSKNEQKDPRGPANGSKRIYRGGSWRSRFASLRVTGRSFNMPTYSYSDVGFRIVCECG